MVIPLTAIYWLLQTELNGTGDCTSYLQSLGIELGCGGATGSVGMGGGR